MKSNKTKYVRLIQNNTIRSYVRKARKVNPRERERVREREREGKQKKLNLFRIGFGDQNFTVCQYVSNVTVFSSVSFFFILESRTQKRIPRQDFQSPLF